MKDSYLQAKLVAPNLIRLVIFSSLPFVKPEPHLVTDGVLGQKLVPSRVSTLQDMSICDFRLAKELELGHSYFLALYGFGPVPLDVSEATTFPGFDQKYLYDGKLGVEYGKESSKFRVWAPLASRVNLLYRVKNSKKYSCLAMTRSDNGVFEVEVKRDMENMRYLYEVVNSEVAMRVTDPYATGSTQDGEESVVIDFSKLTVDFHRDALPVLNCPTESIIYECHVRDMTIDYHSDIEYKGTFRGLAEKGRKTENGNPAGFDYIRSLGITHIQLLPIYDFKSVSEKDPESGYNWGYDPQQYFVPEGSYASHREDPISRIIDLKNMVASFHEAGIRVVMDVVYNHVYDYQSSVFERVVPNYYFRKRNNGTMANTSGCGDDLATERPMVRKMIVDACKLWIDEYGIDGFRFDLMGIIDIETLKEVASYAKSKDPSFLLYGEGWNMGGDVSVPLGHMGNFQRLNEYGFFNDHYRENCKKYLIGDMGAFNGFKHAYVSSSLHFIYPAKFLNATQTINYIECHDNGTFFDYVDHCHSDWNIDDKLKLCVLGYETILCSFGIPFIHMGQEIGQSKWGDENTYNKGDYFNKFSYALLDQRTWMYEKFKAAVSFRKAHRCLQIYDPRVIDGLLDMKEIGKALEISFLNRDCFAPKEKLEIFINPNKEEYSLKKEGDEKENQLRIPPLSTLIVEE